MGGVCQAVHRNTLPVAFLDDCPKLIHILILGLQPELSNVSPRCKCPIYIMVANATFTKGRHMNRPRGKRFRSC